MVPGEEHLYLCPASPRGHEYHRSQNLRDRQVRLDARPGSLQEDRQAFQPNRNGPICIPPDPSVPSLLQLTFALATDAFLQDWTVRKGFANPPWCLIGRSLQQVQSQQARIVILAPV